MNQVIFILLFWTLLQLTSCSSTEQEPQASNSDGVFLTVLGVAQDAGSPQIGCMKECCSKLWDQPEKHQKVTSLGLVDYATQQTWMFEATPDFKVQSKILSGQLDTLAFHLPSGIFLTHGHMGHYTGLAHLGREAINASRVPVYGLPKMSAYLQSNGPWDQLVALKNIQIQSIKPDSSIRLNRAISVIPITVPHRGEYTETVGFQINGPNKKVLFIPDIDKWNLWDRDVTALIKNVDLALLDATFYANGEVGNRDMSEIPHPFVEESMRLFDSLPASERAKIHFIHFNHTNPLLRTESDAVRLVTSKGYGIAREGLKWEL
ncbi:MBL fold metallo-hydrolase [Marinoscillum sp.]|uniref:MBL fold metallo-hydrolase n=1 Tax=Marinoscillum sp. TaxID=2024838 RepID=UPI003BAAA209